MIFYILDKDNRRANALSRRTNLIEEKGVVNISTLKND